MVVLKKKILTIVLLIFIASCTQIKDFKYGLKEIRKVNFDYNTTMETYPNTIQQIDLMLNDFAELKKTELINGQEPFTYVIGYRMLNLEAEKLYIESQKYGRSGTTKYGFGCKSRPLIIESSSLRNSSALKGFEAVELLREFIDEYPEEAKLANLSEKNALFLNATFYQVSRDARRDGSLINNLCPKNSTLEIYKEEFKKKTNLSEEDLSELTYEEAVDIWKKLRVLN